MYMNCFLYYLPSRDFIYIYDGSQEVDKQTGTILPVTIQSTYSVMTIRFTSDHEGEGKGFQISVKYLLAGKYILKDGHYKMVEFKYNKSNSYMAFIYRSYLSK